MHRFWSGDGAAFQTKHASKVHVPVPRPGEQTDLLHSEALAALESCATEGRCNASGGEHQWSRVAGR